MKPLGCIVPVSQILVLVLLTFLLSGCASTSFPFPIKFAHSEPASKPAMHTKVATRVASPVEVPVIVEPAQPDPAPVAEKPKKKGVWQRIKDKFHRKPKV